MPTEVILPKVDMDMATGQISRWFAEEGAHVKKGDVLFEIETDKAAMEIDAPASGVLRDVTGKEGVDIAVGAAVAWIYADGEAYGDKAPISPLEGEMSAKPTEGVVSGGTAPALSPVEPTPPDRPAAGHPPLKGEGDVLRLFEPGSYELVPHDNMRKTIARRLVEAKTTIPHFYLTLDCELDALLALRTQINAAAPVKKTEKGEAPAYKLSVNDMVIKAMALALKAVPDANASWTESAMVKHKHADVGVAVSIPGGLITPIIRHADEKTLSVISNEMKDLASRARSRKLKPEEYQGGTTAVSNLGMFGIKDFAAVINPPHATILAVGAGEERAVVKNGEIKIATVMSVTLSTDHRAVDGALGAELLVAFKRLIENPMGMLV
ncbi:dihydrolipoamide acetyltransferase family protein [Mesorhizobium sp. B263B2A]|uniref:dihydrolipoamide acetyltransferase family protein n=1 Tax=Mesorhizobium sp. B263B2A TaxID=2876669 RepID=UPI001CD105F7|nr:dihydrolipoamide acetyltransferase family protein [Mesorhizobium sp. B263B2A]MCA0031167.1 2-oxo acid dehydrogenase subunit E2 [Mesorhizobium sp. B263B2A]